MDGGAAGQRTDADEDRNWGNEIDSGLLGLRSVSLQGRPFPTGFCGDNASPIGIFPETLTRLPLCDCSSTCMYLNTTCCSYDTRLRAV
jgi:hypothetical protein